MKSWNLFNEHEQQEVLKGQLRLILQKSMEESGKDGPDFIEHIRDSKTACLLFNKMITFLLDEGTTFAFTAIRTPRVWIQFMFSILEQKGNKKVINLPFLSIEDMLKFLE